MKWQKGLFFLRVVFVLAGIALLLPVTAALAHGHVMVGDYELAIGFATEPAVVGDRNGLGLRVRNTKTNEPVTGLEDTLQAELIFGSSSKVLKITPVAGQAGAYTAPFIPSEVGDYTWRIFGTIEGTPVDASMTSSPDTFSPVEPRSGFSFPSVQQSENDLREEVNRAQQTAVMAMVAGGIGILIGIISMVLALTRGRGIAAR